MKTFHTLNEFSCDKQRFSGIADPYDVKLESVTRTSDYTVGVLMVSNDDRETYGAVTDCYDFPTWNEAATQYVFFINSQNLGTKVRNLK